MNNTSETFASKSSTSEELRRVITEHLPTQDEQEFSLGDTFDIKTSIILVVIVFLAEQSRKFMETQMPIHWHNIQRATVCALIIAGVLSLWELIPREYKTRMGHGEFLGWVEQLKDFYNHEGVANPEAKIAEFIRTKDVQRTHERITANKAINTRKSRAMAWSFYFVMVAVVLNLATLFSMSLNWRF